MQAYEPHVASHGGVVFEPSEFGQWYHREDLAKIEFTYEERDLLSRLGKAHNLFCKLPAQHPSDIEEWVASLHDLQKLIMVRVARRMHQDLLTNLEKE